MYVRNWPCKTLREAKAHAEGWGFERNFKWRAIGGVARATSDGGTAEWCPTTQMVLADDIGSSGGPEFQVDFGASTYAPRPWQPIRLSWAKGRTPPELALNMPCRVIFGDFEPFSKLVRAQIEEVIEKMQYIRVPKRFGRDAVVAHKHDRKGGYHGFEILAECDALRLNDYSVGIERWLEMGRYAPRDRLDERQWTPSFFRAFTGDSSVRWNRAQCEAFFDDDDNFFMADQVTRLTRLKAACWTRVSKAVRDVAHGHR